MADTREIDIGVYSKVLSKIETQANNAYSKARAGIQKSSLSDEAKAERMGAVYKNIATRFGNVSALLSAKHWDVTYGTDFATSARTLLQYDKDLLGRLEAANERINPNLTDEQILNEQQSIMQKFIYSRANVATTDYATKYKMKFARITHSGACAFCCMLAGRGYVYASKESAGEFNRYHRNCKCIIAATKKGYSVKGYDPDKFAEKFQNEAVKKISKSGKVRYEFVEDMKKARETARVKAEAEKATRIAQQAEAKAAKALKVLRAKAKKEAEIKELFKTIPKNVKDPSGGKAWHEINDNERKFYTEFAPIAKRLGFEVGLIYNDPTKRTDDFIMGGVKYELKQPGVESESGGSRKTITNALDEAIKKEKLNVMLDLNYIKMSRKELKASYAYILKSSQYGGKLKKLGVVRNGRIKWLK
jgi:hypothetical protein